jgi:glycosyltransferase involved in cell wall biosynthesis
VSTGLPLVTLGVPVRNGAGMLRAALDSIVAQDYPNIEIVVSDNASDDATPDILAEYAARHPNMRVIRQEKPLTAIDNFLFVMREAKGEFFAWCAHDDTRSRDFVSGLIQALNHPRTVLAFGDLNVWNGADIYSRRPDYDFANVGLSKWERIRKAANMQCYHVYGLWRTSALRSIRYSYAHWWSDMPIMLAAASIGYFRRAQGPQFNYFEVLKPDSVTAQYHNQRAPKGRIHDILCLSKATFTTVARTGGLGPAIFATCCIVDKYLRRATQIAFNKVPLAK